MKHITILLAFATSLLLAPFAAAQSKQETPFKPETHGFKFNNNFAAIHQLGLGVDARTNGLCGGWSYTALDYYFAKRSVPTRDYRPPPGTPLHNYLRGRWAEAIGKNLDKWAELFLNPGDPLNKGGARDREFFNWGLNERLQELRSFIDRGIPVPLGFKFYKGDIAKDHVVIAIGYNLGRYKGDLKSYKEDLKIFVCDPNHPGQTMTMRPKLNDAKNGWYFNYPDAPQYDDERWRTYFVDTRYARKTPPTILEPIYPKDGTARELILEFSTGADDLRGGNDNVNLTINLLDGTQQYYANINRGAKYAAGSKKDPVIENAQVVLQKPILPAQIKSLDLSTTFKGGPTGDNWDMNSVSVRAIGGGPSSQIASYNKFFRFTGQKKQLTIPVNAAPPAPPGQVATLVLEVRTGSDDLRGGNDNLNVETVFQGGRTQQTLNVNAGNRWADNTTKSVTITLNKPVPVSDITTIKLRTTFSGGAGGDNWNMDNLRVRAVGPGVDRLIATYGFYRFTGQKKELTINTTPAAAPPGQVASLVLEVRTGGDDLRGGNDNLNVEIGFQGGRTQQKLNVNAGKRWADNMTTQVTIPLNKPVAVSDIKNIKLSTTFSGGTGGDNWNMDSLRVRAVGSGVDRLIATYGFYRFTAQKKQLTIPVTP